MSQRACSNYTVVQIVHKVISILEKNDIKQFDNKLTLIYEQGFLKYSPVKFIHPGAKNTDI